VIEALVALDEAGDELRPSLKLAADVMSVADAMDSQYLLRRSLSEPHADADQLKHLAETLLGPSISAPALSLIKVATAQSWDSAEQLSGAVRDQAVRLAWRAACADGDVEHARLQVLDLMVLVTGDPQLSTAVGDITRDESDRQAFVARMVVNCDPVAKFCATSAVNDQRAPFTVNLDGCLESLARVRGHLRGRVTTAVWMTKAQSEALTAQLQRIYGKPIDLETVVDPRVVGGALVNVGGDVIDGSIKARLDTARESLVSVPIVVEAADAAGKDGENA